MAQFYNYDTDANREEEIKTVLGVIATAAVELSKQGFADNDIYEIIERILGTEFYTHTHQAEEIRVIIRMLQKVTDNGDAEDYLAIPDSTSDDAA